MKYISKRCGFSLVELMLVIAIIGIMATIAIPGFQRYQNKARMAQATLIFDAITKAEKAHMVSQGTFFKRPSDVSARASAMADIVDGKSISMSAAQDYSDIGDVLGDETQIDFVFWSITGAVDDMGNDLPGFGNSKGTKMVFPELVGTACSTQGIDLQAEDFGAVLPGVAFDWSSTSAVANFSLGQDNDCLVMGQTLIQTGDTFMVTPIIKIY